MLYDKKIKIEFALIETGLVEDADTARKLINFGLVFLKDKKLDAKSLLSVDDISKIRILHQKNYVGRGAYKLESVFDKIDIDVENFICLDLGASTGGFCDLLLKKNVAKIYAVDVGKNLLDEKIKNNSKIISIEGVNAKFLSQYRNIIEDIDFCVMDLSFISVKKVIPQLLIFLKDEALFIPLIKPQFECKRTFLKKGIIEDEIIINAILDDMKKYLSNNFKIIDIIKSKIKGQAGNQEYFFVCRKGASC